MKCKRKKINTGGPYFGNENACSECEFLGTISSPDIMDIWYCSDTHAYFYGCATIDALDFLLDTEWLHDYYNHKEIDEILASADALYNIKMSVLSGDKFYDSQNY